MCNIAGYIGKKQAAPILIEMMRREEGYAGGFYTGITVHNGERLVSQKVLGDLSVLEAKTDCRSLVGTCGFLHSRSRSGGGREWAQPFLSADRKTSLIANGAAGCFLTDDMKKKRCDIAMSLEADGYIFGSRTVGVVGDYPALADGTAIHSTDLMCQYATRLIDRGMPIDAALSETVSELPCEAVVLMMRKEKPDSVFISRINYPMTVGIADDGDIYFATTRLAFPEDVHFKRILLLPAMQTYEITRGGFCPSVHPIRLPFEVCEITETLADAAYPLFLERLAGSDSPLQGCDLLDAYASVWPKGMIDQAEPMLYVMLERLAAEGRLGITPLTVEGSFPGHTGTKFGIFLK